MRHGTRVPLRLPALAALLLSILVVPAPAALAQTPAGTPVIRYQSAFSASGLPARYDAVQMIIEFPPGAAVPPHIHHGPIFVTLLDGQVTWRNLQTGAQRVYGPGETWTEIPDLPHEAHNAGSVTARMLATAIVPEGAEFSTLVGGGHDEFAGGVIVVQQIRRPMREPLPALSAVQIVVDLPAGSGVSTAAPGLAFYTVVGGEAAVAGQGLTFDRQDPLASRSWAQTGRGASTARGLSSPEARLAVTFLRPLAEARSPSIALLRPGQPSPEWARAPGTPVRLGAPAARPVAPPSGANLAPVRQLPRTGEPAPLVPVAALGGLTLLMGGALRRRIVAR